MHEKIRLLQITHDLAIGGLQQVVVNLCRTIDRDLFDVRVLCLRALGPLCEELTALGLEVMLLPQKERGTDYFSFFKVAEIVRSNNIQVIHTHNTQPLVDGAMGAILSGRRPRIIHTDHARNFPDKKRYMAAEWLLSHFVHKMVGVSEHTTNNLHQYEKIARRKLTTIANGIDQSRYAAAIDPAAKRRELGITADSQLLGIISRLDKIKGITFLLRAMPEIIRSYPAATLLVAGEGEERQPLEDEAARLGLDGRVLFLGPRMDVPDLLKILDIYLLPSLSEGLPMGLLEAAAAGCPVVASGVGGIPGVITHEQTGLLVNPGKPEELAQAVIRLLGDRLLRQKITAAMQTLFTERYSAESMTAKYCQLYMKGFA